MLPQTRNDLIELLDRQGEVIYDGEGVTQLQHAWQCARLAQQAGAAPALVAAAWLHDIGHLIGSVSGTPTLQGVDDRHEKLGGELLTALFGPEVGSPVALHVAAKRCLVHRQPGYAAALSADSQRSLALQGGAMGDAEAHRFLVLPFARDALRLRAWDDRAKDPHLKAAHRKLALAELAALLASLPG